MLAITETLALIVLTAGAKHGYVIMGTIASMTNGDYKVPAGTLYRTLTELKLAEMVEETDPPDDVRSTDERRRYYQITEYGRRALTAELKRMARLLQVTKESGLLNETGT